LENRNYHPWPALTNQTVENIGERLLHTSEQRDDTTGGTGSKRTTRPVECVNDYFAWVQEALQ